MRNILTHLIVLAGLAAAAQAAFEVPWSTIDAGGNQDMTGGGFTLSGTTGQPDAGPNGGPMSGGGWQLAGGFWPGVSAPSCSCLADLNHDGRIDGRDVQSFVRCVTAPGGDCGCADMDSSGSVTPTDVPAFVLALTQETDCP